MFCFRLSLVCTHCLSAILQSHRAAACHLDTHQVLKSLDKKCDPDPNSVYPEEENREHPKFSTDMRMRFHVFRFHDYAGYAHDFHTAMPGL